MSRLEFSRSLLPRGHDHRRHTVGNRHNIFRSKIEINIISMSSFVVLKMKITPIVAFVLHNIEIILASSNSTKQ